ncbi:hypothetical protein, partial [Streptomyces clavuligerus]|uniref:hypothetical protein n=1 Tax=Streptomyces clavuligerus TaxID=1901 RepID=UPI0018D12493
MRSTLRPLVGLPGLALAATLLTVPAQAAGAPGGAAGEPAAAEGGGEDPFGAGDEVADEESAGGVEAGEPGA